MKKLNKKILGISLGISGLVIAAPIILTSCSTTTNDSKKEFPAPSPIIDFSNYQKSVYVSESTDPTWDPFAPKYKDQELYQFSILLSSAISDSDFQKTKTELNLKQEMHSDGLEYYVKRDFRDINLLKKIFSSKYELQSQKNSNLWRPSTNDEKFRLNGSSQIYFDRILNENLESIVRTKKSARGTKSFTWYVYPKNGHSWDVDNLTTKNAYFSINIY